MQEKGKQNPLQVLKKAIELCMPNLRHYYRITKKAKVVATYASNGQYYVDVQPLRNNETEDTREPIVPKVAMPVMWGGKNRGVVCPPEVGSLCDLSYYDGDPNYPFISNIRWGGGHSAPKTKLKEFVIQYENGVEIRIDEGQQIITLTPQNVVTEAGKNWRVKVGKNASIEASSNASITAGSNASITAQGTLTLSAPSIVQQGNVSISGDLNTSGNSSAGSRSGGTI
ncbi:MAG: phage baseplate assembly protein V [Pseudomonadota bacterium]